jgi:hypothetical protein
VFANQQKLQLSGPVYHKDPANFITLTAGIYVPQFDKGVWVPVPKRGQYQVHFLRTDPVLADRYHNIVFTGSHVMSGRLLLSRFVWSCCKNLQKSGFDQFRSFDGDDDGDDGDDEDHDGTTKKGKGKREGKRKSDDGSRGTKKRRKKGDNEKFQLRATRSRTRATHDNQGGTFTPCRKCANAYSPDDEVMFNDEELASLNDPWNFAAFGKSSSLLWLCLRGQLLSQLVATPYLKSILDKPKLRRGKRNISNPTPKFGSTAIKFFVLMYSMKVYGTLSRDIVG